MQKKWREMERWRRSELYRGEEEEEGGEEEEEEEEDKMRHRLRRKSEPCGIQLLPVSERRRKELLYRRRRKSCDGQEGVSSLARNQEVGDMMMRRRGAGGWRSNASNPLMDMNSKPGLNLLAFLALTANQGVSTLVS